MENDPPNHMKRHFSCDFVCFVDRSGAIRGTCDPTGIAAECVLDFADAWPLIKPFSVSKPTDSFNESSEVRPRRRSVPWLLGGLVLVLLAIIVAQQLFNLWAVVPPETGSDTLLLYALSSLNFAAFVVFSFILLRSLLKLRRERRERLLGSKIQTRLLAYFIALSLLPIAAMAAFSYLFLNRSIEKWMGRLPEVVVERVREQQRENLTFQNEKLRETATLLATTIRVRPQTEWQVALDQLAATEKLSAS